MDKGMSETIVEKREDMWERGETRADGGKGLEMHGQN